MNINKRTFILVILFFQCFFAVLNSNALSPSSEFKRRLTLDEQINQLSDIHLNINDKLDIALNLAEKSYLEYHDNELIRNTIQNVLCEFLNVSYNEYMTKLNNYYYSFRHDVLTLTNIPQFYKLYNGIQDNKIKDILIKWSSSVLEKTYRFSAEKGQREVAKISEEYRLKKVIYFLEKLLESIEKGNDDYSGITLKAIREYLNSNSQDFLILDTGGAQQEFAYELTTAFKNRIKNLKIEGTDLTLNMFFLQKDTTTAVFDAFGKIAELKINQSRYVNTDLNKPEVKEIKQELESVFPALFTAMNYLKKNEIEYENYKLEMIELINPKVKDYMEKSNEKILSIYPLDMFQIQNRFNSSLKPAIVTNFNSLVISFNPTLQYFSDAQMNNAVISMGKAVREGGLVIVGEGDEGLASLVIYQRRNNQMIPFRFALTNSSGTEFPAIQFYDQKNEFGPFYGLTTLDISKPMEQSPSPKILTVNELNGADKSFIMEILSHYDHEVKRIEAPRQESILLLKSA